MPTDRVSVVEENLDTYLQRSAGSDASRQRLAPDAPLAPGSTLSASRAVQLFEDQIASRTLDVCARRLKRTGQSYYTISSAGHEQNAVLGAQLRLTDPCFLHYRSGALMQARARRLEGSTPIFDTLLSLVASSEDPTSEGRHKVWGSRDLWVPPQTSTIASHLPKAVGVAYALARSRRLGVDHGLPADTLVVCSFGDASINHATALAGINAARYASRLASPTPVLFVCEDNRRGISVDTPSAWIQDHYEHLPHLTYVPARGILTEIWAATEHAIQTCRERRMPVFLHLDCVRLWGHAGSDVETTYRSLTEIEATEAEDPVLANAKLLVESGAAHAGELRRLIADVRARVDAAAEEAVTRPRLTDREQIIAPLAPYDEPASRARAMQIPAFEARREVFGERLPEEQESPARRTLAAHVNAALTDLMLQYPETLVFGEDVGRKGGVYGLTANLQKRFGTARVFDTLLDETTILGVAQGAAQLGCLPICEIQYLAYLHNAIDQLRGEACSLSFFSNRQFQNPMVVRIASFAYQKGFGGHFHNDNAIGALRDIPGLWIAAPSRGDDAARLLRAATALARENGSVVAFLEPIALYHERDLYAEGDGQWLSDYPEQGQALFPGTVGLYGPDDAELLIVSYANGLRLSLRAARRLKQEHGKSVRVLDLRWLSPLPFEAVSHYGREAQAVLVVDECRATGGGVADAIGCALYESRFPHPFASVRAADCYVPLGSAANAVLVSEDQIVSAALELCS